MILEIFFAGYVDKFYHLDKTAKTDNFINEIVERVIFLTKHISRNVKSTDCVIYFVRRHIFYMAAVNEASKFQSRLNFRN